ncbi:hypothetical protein BC332_07710 [Capsicum chinense]|nr:hypothetical protein BC332_07710 [Capsicum chinense]
MAKISYNKKRLTFQSDLSRFRNGKAWLKAKFGVIHHFFRKEKRYDRYCICIEDMRQSVWIIVQCLNQMPSGMIVCAVFCKLMDIIITIQFTYGGVFLSDPDLRFCKLMDIIITIQFTYGGVFLSDPDLRVNKKGYYYKLENDVDVLSLISSFKNGDLVDVYVVHQINEPILVNDGVAATLPLLVLSNGDVAASFEPNRADVSSSYPLDINEDKYINENQPPRGEKGKAKTDSDGDSLYAVDENIEELSDFDEDFL